MSKKNLVQLGVLLLCLSSLVSLFGFTGNVNQNFTTMSFSGSDSIPFQNNGWTKRDTMPIQRYLHTTVFYRGNQPNDTGYIYALGGSFFDLIQQVCRYNVITGIWNFVSPLPQPKESATAITVGNKIFYPGGNANGVFLKTMSIYDIPSDSWTTGSDMPLGVSSYVIGKYADSLIYVMGGYGTWMSDTGIVQSDTNIVQIYNINTNTWSIGTPMRNKTTRASGGINGNKIIIVGGFINSNVTNKVEIGQIDPNNPNLIIWTSGMDYPIPIASASGTVLEINNNNGAVITKPHFVFTGGINFVGISQKSTYAYDLQTNNWLTGPDKLTGIFGSSNLTCYQKDDSVYVMVTGGYGNFGPSAGVEVLSMGALPHPVHLISPANGSILSSTPNLDWNDTLYIDFFNLQISSDSLFNTIIFEDTAFFSNYTFTPGILSTGTKYYWRVRSENVFATSGYSNVYSFTIANTSLPAAPSDLSLLIPAIGEVAFTWTDNSSNEDGYVIQRKDNIDTNWTNIDSMVPNTTNWSDSALNVGRTYYYRLYAYNDIGNSAYSNEVNTIITHISENITIPKEFTLYQNYPNPFNPSTKIKYDIPKAGFVSLKIYDIAGREVAKLVDNELAPAQYEVEWNASDFASGVYFYRLQAGDFVKVQRMILVK